MTFVNAKNVAKNMSNYAFCVSFSFFMLQIGFVLPNAIIYSNDCSFEKKYMQNLSSIYRNITPRLAQAILRSPAVLIVGPRQSGKTTLIQSLKGYHFVTLDDIRFLDSARTDPMSFIAQLPKPLIIDNIQKAPNLFLAIKYDIDRNRIPGRYVLIGDANPFMIPKVGDSLAGRVEVLTLYPFSQSELAGVTDSFVDLLWSKELLSDLKCQKLSQKEFYEILLTGGYPSVQNVSEQDRDQWFHDYVGTILQKDMIDLATIEHIKDVPRLLALCAARAGSLVNMSELSRDSGLSATTLQRYIALLETLYFVSMQPAWSGNIAKRMIKSPKSYLVDTGLLSWLRMLNMDKLLQSVVGEKGHVIENFVVNELAKQMTWSTSRCAMYHFRSASNVEVDIVLERMDGKIVGIEVKSNQQVSNHDAQGLLSLKEALPADKWHRGIVLYGGDVIVPLADGIIALPISALWAQK